MDDDNINYGVYDRYKNISARGVCTCVLFSTGDMRSICVLSTIDSPSAVHLNGEHRTHDYINGNVIEVNTNDTLEEKGE